VGKVKEVGNFGRLWRLKIFRSQIGRQMYEVGGFGKFCEVREVRKFRRSGGLVELGGEKFSRMFSPVLKVFLQLHVVCVCYISCGYRPETYYSVEVFLITTLLIQVVQLLTCFIRNDSLLYPKRQLIFEDLFCCIPTF
jgi:hypothetical protein